MVYVATTSYKIWIRIILGKFTSEFIVGRWYLLHNYLLLITEKFELLILHMLLHSLEYWAFELLVIIAGLMPNSEGTTSLVAIWYFLLIFTTIAQFDQCRNNKRVISISSLMTCMQKSDFCS